MKVLVMDSTGKVLSLECESTDTLAHLRAQLDKITGISLWRNLAFDGKWWSDDFSENKTLAEVAVQDGSFIIQASTFEYHSCGEPRRRPENDYLYYADAFKSGWREEHARALLHLLLKLCQDGTISERDVTDEAWIRIQNTLKDSMKCSFQIDFLKNRLRDYKNLYSVLAETTSSSFFEWDHERKTITISFFHNWREEYPELLLLCGEHIPYFDTLEEVCLSVNTTRSSEQRVFETSTNINNAREASSLMGEICIRHPSDSNLSPMGSSTLIGKENGYLPSTLEILVVDETAKVFSVECESTDTIAHLIAKLVKIKGRPFRHLTDLMFDGKKLDYNFLENMMLVDVGVQDGSFILHVNFLRLAGLVCRTGIIERPRQRPECDYLYYADVFKSGWREEHAKALLHLLLKLCQDGTISEGEGNVTDKAWLTIHNSLKNSMKCSFQIDFLKERLRDYMQLYSVLTDPTNSMNMINWGRERKTITFIYSHWRKQYPELLLLCGPHISYFDTLEEVCLLLNTGQSSEQRVSESSTNISTMHGKQVGQDDIPLLSKFKSLFGKSQRS